MIEEISDWNYTTDLSGSRDTKLDKRYVISDDLAVFYDGYMDGGGTAFAGDMIDIIRYVNHQPRFPHALEWCSGPGFIGFTLLHNNLAEKVTFVDQYMPSLTAIQKTLEQSANRYSDKVAIAQTLDSNGRDHTYDLIVANPPWYAHPIPGNSPMRNRIAVDLGWQAHKYFFSMLPDILCHDGICIMIESIYGSSPVTFQDYIANAHLEIKSVLKSTAKPHLYYLVIKHARS